jgi:phosphatidylinositol alpha-1,6-mannosyltransferase
VTPSGGRGLAPPSGRARVPLLFLALDFPPRRGGIQTLAGELCGALRRSVPHVVAPALVGDSAFDTGREYPVWRSAGLPLPGGGRNGDVAALSAAAVRAGLTRRFGYVFASHVRLAPAAALVARMQRIPYGVWLHGREVDADRMPVLRTVQRRAVRGAHRVVASSRFTASLAIAAGAPSKRVVAIHPGVGRRFLDAPADPVPAHRWAPPNRQVLLTVGRLHQEHKGHDTVIKALPAIAAAAPNAVYVVAGTGPMQASLAHLAASLGVADRVVFAGAVSDAELLALYDRCDVFVMPSRATATRDVEGFGIVFTEAAARGKPAVAGAAGGAAEAVIDGETGVVLADASPEAVAAAIVELLRDRDRARTLGAAAAARARRHFDWASVATRVESSLFDD